MVRFNKNSSRSGIRARPLPLDWPVTFRSLRTAVLAAGFMIVLMFAALTSPANAKDASPSTARHTVMISIDGLRPDIYLNPDQERVKVPNLISLRDRGVYAQKMIGVFPTVTYPSHTTMVTGVSPARHGIPNNFRPGTRDWYLNASDIKVPTLWDAYRQAGRTTAIVTWPATYGAKVDWLIPENLSFGINDVPGKIAAGSTPGLFQSLSAKTGLFEIPAFEKPDAGEKLDRMTAAFAAELIKRNRPNLLLLHFLDVDHVMHASGPNSDAARHAVELVDQNLGLILQALRDAGIEEQTNVIIVGDHGFLEVHTSINLAALLNEVDEGPRPVRAVIGGASAGLHPVEGASTAQVQDFLEKLQSLIDRRYQGLLRYMTKAENNRAGGFPGAVAALTVPRAGYMLTERPGAPLLIKLIGTEGMHGYDPDLPGMETGFIAAGPSFRIGYRMPVMRMLDVAPTLAIADGVDFAGAEGVAVPGILRTTGPSSGSLTDFLMGNGSRENKR